jgi:hypothetical protein
LPIVDNLKKSPNLGAPRRQAQLSSLHKTRIGFVHNYVTKCKCLCTVGIAVPGAESSLTIQQLVGKLSNINDRIGLIYRDAVKTNTHTLQDAAHGLDPFN